MKSIIFDGRLGRDAEVHESKNGVPYVKFNVANNSFYGGEERTDWFDVVSYDPYIIEKRVQFLKKGSYVIITGGIVTEFNISKDGKAYINHKVTATNIDTPRFGKPNTEDSRPKEEEPKLSVYTGGTPTIQPSPMPNVEMPVAASTSNYVPQYTTDGENDDDLPF